MKCDPVWAAALRLLTRRGYGEAELTARLRDKGFEAPRIAAVIDRCRDLRYLDDRRFATARARALLRNGKAAGIRILIDLQRRGIDSEIAASALAEAEADHPTEEQLRKLLQRRYPAFSYARSDISERRRIIAYFVRRGFPLPLVLSTLQDERDDS